IPTAPMAGKTRDFRSAQLSPHRVRATDYRLFERLLDRARERKQSLLDEHRHLADIADGLLPLVEDARVPFDPAGQFIHLPLVVAGSVLLLSQLENRRSDLVGEFLLLAGKSLDPVHHLAALAIERLKQPGKNELRLLLALGGPASDGVGNGLLRVFERRA